MANFNFLIGEVGSFNLVSTWFETTLNGITKWEIALDGVNSINRAEITTGAIVDGYLGSSHVISGVIENIKNLQGGGMIIGGFNVELDLAEEECPIDSGKTTKTYTSTDDDTIFADLITSLSGTWFSDVASSTATSVSAFRVSESMSVWEGIIQLIRLTAKDIHVNISTQTVSLLDRQGSNDAFAYNEGLDIGNISFNESKPKASKVIIYGKGDGTQQITGSAGSGTPVVKIIDRNILNSTEADNRATKELALISAATKQYRFNVYDVTKTVTVGDRGSITANSLGLFNAVVDVVAVRRGVDQKGIEVLNVQVSNSEYRVASRSQQASAGSSKANYLTSQSSMQGSGNLAPWAGQINGNSTYGLKIPFYIDSRFEDEAGVLRIDSLGIDYDIDKYSSQFGTATDSGHDHDTSTANTINHKHDPADGGHDHGLPTMTSSTYTLMSSLGTDSITNETISTAWESIFTYRLNGTYEIVYCVIELEENSWSGTDVIGIKITTSPYGEAPNPTIKYIHNDFPITTADAIPFRMTIPIDIMQSTDVSLTVSMYSDGNLAYDGAYTVIGGPASHSHSITGYDADSDNAAITSDNENPALTGDTDENNASITIGDGVGEAAGVNATDVSIFIDKWNTGTSAWDNKASGSPGDTLGWNYDPGAGVYPDSTGWWRARILTNHATADLIKGIVKVKHQMDN